LAPCSLKASSSGGRADLYPSKALWSIFAAVAASTELIARDAARKIKVEYEVLPHIVNEANLEKATGRVKPPGSRLQATRTRLSRRPT
jgi:xanthine dehydrogenase molybdopterin-binding subunit B